MQTWRIVTYNTWKCDGLYHDRLIWMGRALSALSPDIVCLQEAFECPARSLDTISHLSSALGMRSEVLKAREKMRRIDGERHLSRSNLAILARQTMTREKDMKLADHADDKDRWAMHVAISNTDGFRLRIINTHLSHLRGKPGTALRNSQARQLRKILDPGSSEAIILCGDLNEEWGDASLSPLQDCNWFDADQEETGPTFLGERKGNHSAARRIDHVQITAGSKTVIKLRRRFPALNTPVGPDGEYPSDHAALVVDFDINLKERV